MIFVYNSLFILSLGKLFENKIYVDKHKRFFLFITFFQMILIQGLRAVEVGTDTLHYVNTYNNFLTSEYYSFLFTHYELGFQGIYVLFHRMGLGSQWLLIIISAMTLFFFALFIYRNSENVVLSTFIFACIIYPNSFNIMRQALGLSIAINCLYYILNNKYIKALFIIVISYFFHSTAILMLIPFLLYGVKNWKIIRNLILFSSVVFFLFGNQIVDAILPLLGKSFYLSGFNVIRLLRMTSMLTGGIAFVSWYFLNNAKTDSVYKTQLNLFSGIAFVNMVCGVLYLKYEFFSRIIEYYNVFLIVSVPIWILVGKRKYRKIYRIGFITVVFLLMLNMVFNSKAGIENYSFFFS